ncbi:regulator of volume decrease after cellular swelling-domain-containing protein [Coniochaeta sp. 2T2.1]|nr:regulator of volume decrease after cellular swelling-domain-containing protein [Coniochaeta sp. 2T2.1]
MWQMPYNRTQYAHFAGHLRTPPSLSDYVPLSDYQAQTPDTFHGGKPVLYYHATSVLARVYESQSKSLPFFSNHSAASFPERPQDDPEEKCEQLVDLFISSENFTIFSPRAESGLSIPYPLITLHAIKKVQNMARDGAEFPSVYVQLELSDGGADDESYDTVELTLIPQTQGARAGAEQQNEPQPEETRKMFEAISECSNLNPDPLAEDEDEDEDEDDDLPPPMPGSSGWIPAENVSEYFDEEGEGAGRVRGREEVEGEEEVNGHEAEADDSEKKRVRTE